MHRWRIGEVEVVRIEDVDFAMPAASALPGWTVPELAPSVDEHRVAFSALAIRDGGTTIVVDPWLQAERGADDAAATADRLLGALADAGVPADEVDLVVYSHLEGLGWGTRPDGAGWALSFPHATYLFPSDEVDAARRGVELPGLEDFRVLDGLTAIEPVASPRPLGGSTTVVPTGGHSEGHAVVRIESDGELAIYLGHLVIHPVQLVEPGVHELEAFSAEAADARGPLLAELADRGGVVLTTLVGGPGGGAVRSDGNGFRVEPAHLAPDAAG